MNDANCERIDTPKKLYDLDLSHKDAKYNLDEDDLDMFTTARDSEYKPNEYSNEVDKCSI
jgi:hypothetical protein